jgi:hypothetical protein
MKITDEIRANVTQLREQGKSERETPKLLGSARLPSTIFSLQGRPLGAVLRDQ